MGKKDRDPFANRYDSEETEELEKTDETEEGSKDSKTPLRERTNINMYIEDESLVDDLQIRYKKLDLEWQEQYGEDLPKNDEYYPAVLRSALNETSIREELGLE
jgi:hypothetical protein